MVRRCICKREAGERAEGQNGEIEPLGLDFERAVGNGGEYEWGEVVRWCGGAGEVAVVVGGVAFANARWEKG
jgi:hypothetical protein